MVVGALLKLILFQSVLYRVLGFIFFLLLKAFVRE